MIFFQRRSYFLEFRPKLSSDNAPDGGEQRIGISRVEQRFNEVFGPVKIDQQKVIPRYEQSVPFCVSFEKKCHRKCDHVELYFKNFSEN